MAIFSDPPGAKFSCWRGIDTATSRHQLSFSEVIHKLTTPPPSERISKTLGRYLVAT